VKAALLVLLLVPASARAAAVAPPASGAGSAQGPTVGELLRTIPVDSWRLSGSASLNWRNVGPKKPGFETQIQNEVYLADMYFGFHGPLLDGVPLLAEFQIPTGSQGQPNLYRFYLQYERISNWNFQLGKFLVPFGRYNELYRPDMFLTVTRPLLYASPDSLDLVVRLNSPRPVFSSGYTDIGARASYYPSSARVFVPSEATLYVVNGLSESANRQRTFPTPDNLGIEPPPPNGVSMDFGHENNNLADNNNNKAIGGRVVYALGSLNLPWPIPEGKRDLNGVALGLSGMYGEFALEPGMLYKMVGTDLSFEYEGINVSAEYVYGFTDLKSPVEAAASSTTLVSPTYLLKQSEEQNGYYVQASFPILKHPKYGQRVTGVLVFNQMFRSGPLLDLLSNQTVNGTLFPSIAAASPENPRIHTRITKLTAALNYQITEHFIGKFEYSYWTMNHASTVSGTRDIYQGAFSLVMSF